MKQFFKTLSMFEKGILMLATIVLVSTTLVTAKDTFQPNYEEGEIAVQTLQKPVLVNSDSMPSPLPVPMVEAEDGSMVIHPKLAVIGDMSEEGIKSHFESILQDPDESEELKAFIRPRLNLVEASQEQGDPSSEMGTAGPSGVSTLSILQQIYPTHSVSGQ